MCIPHEYIVVGSSSLSSSVSSSFIAQHRHACSAMLIATSNHANTHPAESTSHRARNTSPHTHSSPAIVGFSTDNLKMPYALRTRKPPRNDPLLTALLSGSARGSGGCGGLLGAAPALLSGLTRGRATGWILGLSRSRVVGRRRCDTLNVVLSISTIV